MLHINSIPLKRKDEKTTYWAKFELDNESIKCRFLKDRKTIYSVHNITYPYGTIGMVVYLSDKMNAQEEVEKIIARANVDDDSELKGLLVYHSEYHR